MNSDEFMMLYEFLTNFGLGALVGGCVIYFFIKSYIPNYLSEKAKNLAQKEDIAVITNEVEKVKANHQAILEEVKTNNQLKISAIEREKTLKKEVYLDAIESITKTQGMIAAFSNLNISEDQISSGFANENGKIAKVQLVGSEKTVEAVTKFMGEIGEATLSLMLKRSSLISRKNEIQLIEGFRVKSQSEVDRYVGIMKDLNLRGIIDEQTWANVKTSYETEFKQLDGLNEQLDELWRQQNAEHMEFVKVCMEKFFYISSMLPQALLSAREELDLAIHEEKYLKIVERNVEKGREVFEQFMSQIKTQMSNN